MTHKPRQDGPPMAKQIMDRHIVLRVLAGMRQYDTPEVEHPQRSRDSVTEDELLRGYAIPNDEQP